MIEADKSLAVIEVTSNKIRRLGKEAVENLRPCLSYFVSKWPSLCCMLSHSDVMPTPPEKHVCRSTI